MTLLDNALKACGGLERWNRFGRFEAHVSIGGSYLASKVDATNLKEIVVSGNTRFQAAEVVGMLDRSGRGLCRANWVGMENHSGLIAAQQYTPEDFAKLGSRVHWTELDLVYYCGISIWNFINCPFFLAENGFKIGEIAPLDDNGEVWRRLHITFPDEIATEAREQILYFDFRNRHRRTDHLCSALTANSVAHFLSAHQDFSEIVVPTLRRSRFVDRDGCISQEGVPFDIEIFDLIFSG
jgi:hypothetical protein